MKPSDRLWEICLLNYGSVKTSAEVQELAINYPRPDHARAPGPLFRCLIVDIEDCESAAMVMYGESGDPNGNMTA